MIVTPTTSYFFITINIITSDFFIYSRKHGVPLEVFPKATKVCSTEALSINICTKQLLELLRINP
jgi:hypothetical protein